MTYEQILQLATVLALISVAVERTQEIIINMFKLDDRLKNKNTKRAVYHLIAAAIGAVIYLINKDQNIAVISTHFNQYVAPLVVGLLASGGSGFWHDILKIVAGMGLKKTP